MRRETVIPILEQPGVIAWEAVIFALIGAVAAYFLLAWRARKRPDHADAAPAVAIAAGVAALAFLPEGVWRLDSFFAGVIAAGLGLVLARWKRPKGKNACARDIEKMSRWGNDGK